MSQWTGDERRRNVNWDQIISHMAATNEKLDSIKSECTELKNSIKLQNGRIGKLENWRSWMVGGMATITGIFAFLKK